MVSGPAPAVPVSPLLPSRIHTGLLRHCYYTGPVGASGKQAGRKLQWAGRRSAGLPQCLSQTAQSKAASKLQSIWGWGMRFSTLGEFYFSTMSRTPGETTAGPLQIDCLTALQGVVTQGGRHLMGSRKRQIA